MIRTFYVLDDGCVYHSVGFDLYGINPNRIEYHITTDDRYYDPHDPNSVCDPSLGVTIQLEYYLKNSMDLTKLKYFRSLVKNTIDIITMYVVYATNLETQEIAFISSVWSDYGLAAACIKDQQKNYGIHKYKFHIQDFSLNNDTPF